MLHARPVIAASPITFGKRPIVRLPEKSGGLFTAEDARLFFSTFAVGFTFVAVLIA